MSRRAVSFLCILLLVAAGAAPAPGGARAQGNADPPGPDAAKAGAEGAAPGPGHTAGAAAFARYLGERGIPPLLAAGLISLIPVFELRGGIPAGIALLGLHPLAVYGTCVAFNLVPVLPVLLLLRPLRRLVGRIRPFRGAFRLLDRRVEKRRALVERYEELGLTLFVGIPLPITGAWTGSLLAAALGLRLLPSVLFIFLGVLLAGTLVTLLTLLRIYGLLIASVLLIGFGALYLVKMRHDLRAGGGSS